MKFLNKFKEFITKGNVIEPAVAVVTVSSFGSVISSLTNDVITPSLTRTLNSAHEENLDKLM